MNQRPRPSYVRVYPNDYLPFVRLGYSYYMQGLYDLAVEAYKEAERLNPTEKEIKDTITLCNDMMGKEVCRN